MAKGRDAPEPLGGVTGKDTGCLVPETRMAQDGVGTCAQATCEPWFKPPGAADFRGVSREATDGTGDEADGVAGSSWGKDRRGRRG